MVCLYLLRYFEIFLDKYARGLLAKNQPRRSRATHALHMDALCLFPRDMTAFSDVGG